MKPVRKTGVEDGEKPKILIVDDRPENLLALEMIFDDEPCDIVRASSGNDALARVIEQEFAVVLLDVQMPEMDGFETAELMRSNKKTMNVPIIFLSAISKEQQHIFKGYEAGAVDYIFKPLEPEILKNKVRVFLRLHNQRKALTITNDTLQQTVEELKKSNRKILEQRKSVIEEERLKVLLEMAGATAHELNQPLMTLLGNIELMELAWENRETAAECLESIKESGMRISRVTKKIGTIRRYDVKDYGHHTRIINLDQAVNILHIEDSEEDFIRVEELLSNKKNISLSHVGTIREGVSLIRNRKISHIDLILMEFMLEDGDSFELLNKLDEENLETPVVIITGKADEVLSSRLIAAGVYDYISKSRVNEESLTRIIHRTLEKSRMKIDVKRMRAQLLESTIQNATAVY